MKPLVKKSLLGAAGVLVLGAAGAGTFVWSQTSACDESLAKVYDIEASIAEVEQSPELIARGKHLAASLGGCAMSDCHGSDLAGGNTIEMGPIGTFTAPNITPGGLGAVYSDGELARLISHGIRKDGRSVRFMPSHEVSWLPENDVAAIVAYVKQLPKVDKQNGPVEIGILAKVLDRKDQFVLDVARRIDHNKREAVPAPEPTAKYGQFVARLCVGCHGETYSGGPLPGAPPDLPTPTNLTPHESGLKGWKYEDFTRFLETGIKKDGEKLNPFMPLEALVAMDDTERRALWDFLSKLEPKELGGR